MPRKKKSTGIGRRFKAGSKKKRLEHIEIRTKKRTMDRYMERFDEMKFEAAEKAAYLSELNRSITEREGWLERINEELANAGSLSVFEALEERNNATQLTTPVRGSALHADDMDSGPKPETSPDEMSRTVFIGV